MEDKKLNDDVDRKLRQYFYSKGEKIDTSECSFSNIESELKRSRVNLNTFGLKAVVIAAGISIVMTVAAFAGMSSVKYYSYKVKTYEGEEVKAFDKNDSDIDFSPKYVTEFENGYKLKEININDTFGINKFDYKCDESKNVEFVYEKEDNKIILKAHKKDDFNGDKNYYMNYKESPYCRKSIENVLVSAWQMERKYVPDGYVLNEDDENLIYSNIEDISFGAPELKVEQVYVSKWVDDGIEYSLYNNDFDNDRLNQDVVSMSADIINK